MTRRQALALPGLAVVMALKPENPVVGGTTLRRAAIRSPNFATGVSGWSINVDGSAEFNNVVIRNGQIVSGTALFYSGVPALGNLVSSISAAAGTDTVGNAYLAGNVVYSGGGTNAAALAQGAVIFYTAPGPGGPWTAGPALAGAAVISAVTNGIPVAVVPALSVSGSQAAGGVLSLSNNTSAPTKPNAQVISHAAADAALGLTVLGDTVPRLLADSNGKLSWSTGALAADTDLYRAGAGILKTDTELDVAGLLKALAALSVTGGITADTESISGSAAATALLTVTNAISDTNALIAVVVAAAASARFIGGQVTGDTNNRMYLGLDPSGFPRIAFGPGNAVPDSFLIRPSASYLAVNSANLGVNSVGNGLQVKEGTNAKQGTAVLSAGTVVVSNTAVTANSRIFLTAQNLGTVTVPSALCVSARTAGTSFTIKASQATDTSTVAYEIFEPAT